MVLVHKHYLPPTPLIPNSPLPLLHYPGLLLPASSASTTTSPPPLNPAPIHTLLTRNHWLTHWIFRYGPTQSSHYHSRAHECMIVLCGTALVRFGVADLADSSSTSPHEPGGLTLPAHPGDVFILPAGTAHKTFSTQPEAEFALLTPGDGHGLGGAEAADGADGLREKLAGIRLDGFCMMGAYPDDGSEWDFRTGGEDEGREEGVWGVRVPERDPVLGMAEEGLRGLWR